MKPDEPVNKSNKARTSRLAIASLVLAILPNIAGCFLSVTFSQRPSVFSAACIIWIGSVVCGMLASKMILKSEGMLTGRLLAMMGVTISLLSLLASSFLFQKQWTIRQFGCQGNITQQQLTEGVCL